ncbi:MAG: sensor histidine kinase [Syntrophomonadaceae bacterium]|nr:sensor histidine kinase [Syntrophomonadaceae bacterium]
MIDITALDRVVKNTILAVEKGKEQIYDIAENARQERVRVKSELEKVKAEVLEVIEEVDRLDTEEKNARRKLMEVSKNFQRYSEEDMQAAYEHARALQIKLGELREREKQLRLRRDKLEVSFRNLEETVRKAEDLVSQVGAALTYLKHDLRDLSTRLEEIQNRQVLGIRVIRAQEEERKRVAREIHDGPAQSMANLVLRAEICEKLLEVDPPSVKKELQELKKMVKDSLQDVRKIIFDLRPMLLDDLGIVPTLRKFLAEFTEKHNFPVDFTVTGQERRLPPPAEVTLFRIAQEALNNTLKHANAHRGVMRLEFLPGRVNLLIADDGKGFDFSKAINATEQDTFGLMGMRERVELLEGKIGIKTSPGKGTQIIVQIPLEAGLKEG